MSAQMQIVDEKASRYATATDYYRIFVEEMDSLYLLAFLLTADKDIAEQSVVGGLGECIERIGVFLERARSWARRAIVKDAIRKIRPARQEGAIEFFGSTNAPGTVGASNPFAFIASLRAFERFVFVMSVLEGQPDEDCQSLLNCSRQDIVMARKAAMKLFGAATRRLEFDHQGLFIWSRILN
jgi:hypothetical protein